MKNFNLNGREMMVGGIIIILIVIRMDVMIRLIIMNGMKIMKLIWNVCLIFDNMNLVVSSENECCLFGLIGWFKVLDNMNNVFGLVWCIMNLWNGLVVRS